MSIVLWYRCPLRSIPDYRLILWFNGFPPLDLRLKKHGVHQLLVMGLIALVWKQRYVMRLSWATKSLMVRDATADYSDIEMHAALDVNIPNCAVAIVTTNEIVDSIQKLVAEK